MIDEKKQREITQTRQIFPLLVYIEDLLKRGLFDEEDFRKTIAANMREHKHDWFEPHQTWKEDLPALINKLGWKIFDLPHEIKKHQRETRKEEQGKKGKEELSNITKKASTVKKFKLKGGKLP